MSAGYRVELPGFTHPEGMTWAWRCNDADHPWHYSVDDQGFAYTRDEADVAGRKHVERFHTDADHPRCGAPIRGRLSLRCNQLESHTDRCVYVTEDGHSFGEIKATP